jgi:DNA-binding SARP family transcriptional activator
MMPEGGSTTDQSAEGWADWRQVCELLKAGQYEQVAELLGEVQATSQQRGNAGLAQILGAARRICLACSQSREEAEWHRQATQEAAQREHELGQQLQAILDLVNGGEVPDAPKAKEAPPAAVTESSLPERDTPESSEPASLWQRVQSLLRRAPDARSAQREPAVIFGETPTLLSTERVETTTTPVTAKERGQAAPSLVVYCLGPFRVYQDESLVSAWNGLKGQCILKYLIAHYDSPIAKDILMDVFWTDADPDAARRNLHQAVYSLRQTLRRGQPDFQHILFENDCYSLNPELDIWIDFKEFEKHIQAGRDLEVAGKRAEAMTEYGIAEGLHQGDFLEEDPYEDWPRPQRQHTRNMYLDIVDRLSGYYVQQGEYTPAVALCQKILTQDNCCERAHRRLMQCYLAQGQRHLALRQYQTCVEALRVELDLMPSEKTVALCQRITAVA